MNIIIFGAAGGIGRHAVKHALAKGYQVTTYLRDQNKLNISDKNLRIVEGEISDYTAVLNALQGQDAVIWCVGIPLKRTYEKMQSLEGHQVLVRAMEEAGVQRLVDWGTPSVPFEKDKKSFITVVPGIMAGIALTMAKKRDGSDRKVRTGLWFGLDACSFYGTEGHSIYRTGESRIRRCENEFCHFPRGYWLVYGGAGGEQTISAFHAHHRQLSDPLLFNDRHLVQVSCIFEILRGHRGSRVYIEFAGDSLIHFVRLFAA